MRSSVTLNLSRDEATHLEALVVLHVERMKKLSHHPDYSDIAAVFQRSLDIEEGIVSKLGRRAT